MKKFPGALSLVIPLLAFSPSAAFGQSFECGTSTYEVFFFSGSDNTWDTARTNVAALPDVAGASAHLATIRSAAEDSCVSTATRAIVEEAKGTNKQVWLGASQMPPPGVNYAEGNQFKNWVWENGEGGVPVPIAGSIPGYQNWRDGEPNDVSNTEEPYMTLDLRVSPAAWNDDTDRDSVVGYVAEWDAIEIDLGDVCVGPECIFEVIPGTTNTIVLPEQAEIGAGATASIRVYPQTDSCPRPLHEAPRSIVLPDLPDSPILIPWYMCREDWAIVTSELTGVEIPFGTVEVEFEPVDFGVPTEGCNAALGPPLDPTLDDLIGYQPLDFLENRANHLEDFTVGCGSSRGLMKGNIFFTVGLNFDVRGDSSVSYATHSEFIDHQMIWLGIEKLFRLKASIIASRPALSWGEQLYLAGPVSRAIIRMYFGDFDRANDLVEVFLNRVDQVSYNDTEFNFNGEHKARGTNISDFLERRVIPY